MTSRHRKLRWLSIATLGLALACATGNAHAAHFDIELTVEGGGEKAEKATAHADDSPPPQGHERRPVVHARHDQPIVVQFFMTSAFPHGTRKGVTVHYYVAAVKEVGQKSMPDVGKDAKPSEVEGRFVMDFKVKGKVGLRQTLHIDRPGVYLVRVQSENSEGDHEHFAALDLVVE